jgi:serine/threonine-protein kinase
VDARADIWALGVMLYELVSGRVPFTGHTPSDVMVAILDREPAPLDKLNPAIPHELQRIVAKALRKDRAQRYQTVADLRLDLEALKGELQASSLDAAPEAASSRHRRQRRSRSGANPARNTFSVGSHVTSLPLWRACS